MGNKHKSTSHAGGSGSKLVPEPSNLFELPKTVFNQSEMDDRRAIFDQFVENGKMSKGRFSMMLFHLGHELVSVEGKKFPNANMDGIPCIELYRFLGLAGELRLGDEDTIFVALDLDNSGAIEFNELLYCMALAASKKVECTLELIFRLVNESKSGTLNSNEAGKLSNLFPDSYSTFAHQTLSEFITSNSAIPSLSESFHINLPPNCIAFETLTGRFINIEYHPTLTCHQVRQAVQDRQGIPPEQQKLAVGGVELKTGKDGETTLEELGVKGGSVGLLVLSLRGF